MSCIKGKTKKFKEKTKGKGYLFELPTIRGRVLEGLWEELRGKGQGKGLGRGLKENSAARIIGERPWTTKSLKRGFSKDRPKGGGQKKNKDREEPGGKENTVQPTTTFDEVSGKGEFEVSKKEVSECCRGRIRPIGRGAEAVFFRWDYHNA